MPDFNNLSSTMVDQSLSALPTPYSPATPDPIMPEPVKKEVKVPEQSLEEYYANKPDEESYKHHVISDAELDANKRYKMYNPLVSDMENEARWGQTTGERLANAGENLVEKTLSYGVQTAGFLLGMVPAAIGGGINLLSKGEGNIADGKAISLMTDNFIVKLADAWKENVQERDPIYKSDQYTNGNIWKKLGTTDWWLDDFTDRLALTAATLAPGFLEAKGVGLFGIAMKEGGIVGKGIAAKAILTMADNPEMYGKLGKYLASNIYKAGTEGVVDLGAETIAKNVAMNFKNVVRGAQYGELVTFNTVGQNALNARETQTSIIKSLREQRVQGLNNYTNDEIDNMGAEGARKGFLYNMPLTLASSIFELPQIFASMRGGMNVLKDVVKKGGIESIAEGTAEAVSAFPKLLPTVGKALFTGFEHGQLESSQVAIGRYIEDAIAGRTKDGKVEKDEGGLIPGAIKGMIDNFTDANGQNNIALGTIQGLLTTIFGTGFNLIKGTYSNQDKINKSFINDLNKSNSERTYFNGIIDLTEKDEKGNIKFTPDNKIVWDQNKLVQLGASQIDYMTKVQARLDAYKSNDRLALDKMNFDSLKNMAYDFFKDANGKEYLTNVLNFQANAQSKNIDRINDIQNGEIITPHIILDESLRHVNSLYKAYNAIDQRHAGFLNLDVNYDDKVETKLAADFTEKYKGLEFDYAADQIYLNNKLQKNNIEEAGLDNTSVSDERRTQIKNENTQLSELLQKSKDGYKNVTNREAINNTWKETKENLEKIKETVKRKKDETTNPTPIDTNKKVIDVDTKKGKVSVEIGTEYYIGKGFEYDEKGLESPIPMRRFTILKEEGDNIVVRSFADDNDTIGTVSTVPKLSVVDYNLGKVSTLKTDKTANYVYNFRNDIFEYNLGDRFGGKVTGRLEYKDSKLFFVYKNAKNELTRKQMYLTHFVPQERFPNARIINLSEQARLGNETVKQKLAREQFASKEDIKKQQENLSKSREARIKIITDIKQETQNHLDEVNKKLSEKKDFLKNIQNDLNKYFTLKQKGKPKGKIKGDFLKTVNTAKTTLNKLNIARNETIIEIDSLSKEQKDLQMNIEWFSDYTQNVDQLDENSQDMLNELKDQIKWLEDLLISTGTSIKELNTLVSNIEDSIKSAAKLLKSAIEAINNKYPSFITQPLNDILNGIDIVNNLPTIKEYLADFIVGQNPQEQIDINETELKDLQDRLNYLTQEYDEIATTYRTKKAILDKMEEIAAKYRQERVEANKIVEQTNIITNSFSDGTAPTHEHIYEGPNKKNDHTVINGTKPNANQTPEQKRTDNFGILWNKLSDLERSKFKSIDITLLTEEKIGLKGLMKYLLSDEAMTLPKNKRYKRENIIARVFVSDNGNLIDQKGNELSPDQLKDPLNYTLFQVLPEPNEQGHLTANYGTEDNPDIQSMFRESTLANPLVVNNLEKQFITRRTAILADTELQPLLDFDASFGSPIYDYILDENEKPKIDSKTKKPIINYNTRTSVENTNVIDSNLLQKTKVVDVITINSEVSEGTVSMNVSEGSTILRIPGSGIIKLFSRKLTNKEANTVYDVLVQLTKDLQNKDNKAAQNTLFNWLKSIVYWGIIKRSTSNIWFENIKNEEGNKVPTLFIKRKGQSPYSTTFTTDGLIADKLAIINELQNIYHNIDAKLTSENEYKNPYNNIIGIGEDGIPIIETWSNYQTYLLSSKNFDNKGTRTDIPLTTPIKPIEYDGDINRKDFYFTIKGDVDDVIHSTVSPEALLKSAPLTPIGAKKQTPVEKVEEKIPVVKVSAEIPSNKFDLGGTKANTISMFSGTETVSFAADESTYQRIENPITKEIVPSIAVDMSINTFPDNQKVIDRIIKDLNKTQEEALALLHAKIVKDILAQIEAEKIIPQLEEPIVEIQKIEIDKTDPFFAADSNDIPDNEAFREKLVESAKKFSPENWIKFKEFLENKFPNIPIYRIKNIIQRTNGKQAWGMFKNGAIYIYENAEIGTGYHEVFEAVWGMFANSNERKSVLKEFRQGKGIYIDRFTNKEVDPSIIDSKNSRYVSDDRIKEEIAEEFSDLMVDGKEPIRNIEKSLIGKLFHDLINFIKTFFTGNDATNNTQGLFDKIGNGYYKEYIPYETKLSFSKMGILDIDTADPIGNDVHFKDKNSIPTNQMNDIIQHFNYMTITTLLRSGEDIFNIDSLSKDDLYSMLKEDILKRVKNMGSLFLKGQDINNLSEEIALKVSNTRDLYYNIINDWKNIVKTHIEYLKGKNIIFNEEEIAVLNDNNEDGVDKAEYVESNKIDSFKRMNSSVKLLLDTLSIVNPDGTFIPSTVGGVTCLSADQVNINLLNALSNSISPDDMFIKLGEYGISHPNYRVLFNRIIGTPYKDNFIDYSKVDKTKLQIISEFWKSFNKQSPDAITLFVLSTGESIISDTTIKGASEVINRDMINKIIHKIKKGTKYFNYDSKTGIYTPSETLKKLSLSGDADNFINFLNTLGIDFKSYKKYLTGNTLDSFKTIVQGIKKSMSEIKETKIINSKKLDIHSRLMDLANLQAMFDHPELESTYYNLAGDKVQTYMNPNVHSRFYKMMSNLLNINELRTNSKLNNFKYLVTDSFSKGSEMLKRIFVKDSGDKVDSEDDLLHPNLVNGMVNNDTGKNTPISKVSRRQRTIIEMNLNLNGRYLILVPGDAALESAITLHNSKSPFITAEQIYLKQHFDIFVRYLSDEIAMSRENRIVAEGRDRKDLRFFKDILGEKTYNNIMKEVEKKYTTILENNLTEEEKDVAIQEIYTENSSEINSAIEQFFKTETSDMFSLLNSLGITKMDVEGKHSLEGIPLMNNKHLSEEELNDELYRLSLNYAIANIELHKLIYGDPYQYNMELKRTKLFGSPKQELLHSSEKINQVFDRIYNEGFTPNDIGWIDFDKEYFNTVTYDDILSKSDLPGYEKAWKETDGATFMNLKANKILKIRTSDWTDENELQYKHDIGYEKLVKDLIKEGKSEEYIKEETDEYEKNNPDIASTYTPIKPSVAGNKDSGRNYNSIVVDKTANFIQSYRLLHQINPNSNALRLYNKMQDENIDYAVFKTSRKEGAEVVHNLYKNSIINDDPYTNTNEIINPNIPQGVIKIPFSIYGISMEVPSKSSVKTSEGTQMRMLSTMDMIEYGVPIDFIPNTNEKLNEWNSLSSEDKTKRSPLYTEIQHNREVLEAKMEQGVDTLFKKLGITKTTIGFKINDVDKLVKTLKNEIFKYTINDNIIKSFNDFKNGTTLLEATPLYTQLRSIIYSIADKQVIHPKISGKQVVQAPNSLLESLRVEIGKDKNDKPIYHSGDLQFYVNEDDKRVCQIMVGKWFDSSLSDEQLLDYFKTDEGKKILSGVAFRIPTQNKNSIDAFEITKFLPKGMRDQVVVPSAIVNKVGSDFDIDKLSVYLKNIFSEANGDIKMVPFYGTSSEMAKNEFRKLFDKINKDEKLKLDNKLVEQAKLSSLFSDIALGLTSDKLSAKWIPIFKDWFEDELNDYDKLSVKDVEQVFIDRIEKYNKKLDKLTNEDLQDILREETVDKWYRESLENEYIQSLENLTSHPMNFSKLISPNSAEILRNISDNEVAIQTGAMKSDYTSIGNLIKRTFMSALRHGNIMGKQFIAIAAVNQKAHAIRQLVATYIDDDRINTDVINKKDGEWLGDGKLKFEKFNKEIIDGKERAVFAKLKDANNEHYISDINGQIIDGAVDITKDNWIIRLGIKPNTVGTWLMLIDLGVPIKSIAYFMNQPIISDFLSNLEAQDKKWLFDSTLFKTIMQDYTPDKKIDIYIIPTEKELFTTMKRDNIKTDLQKSQQQFILKEFMKYAKIAEHSFYVTQASNYDTASFNDPLLLDQKYWQLERARNTIISSVDNLIDNSIIGKMKDLFTPVREALSNVLVTDKVNTRNTLYETLHNYFKLDGKSFLKVSHKAVNDLIDWAMQNDIGINNYIKSILLGKDNELSSVEEVIAYKDYVLAHPEHPLYKNTIINSIKLNSRSGEGTVDNLYIQGRDGKSYNQNLIIHGFEELKEELTNGTKSEQTLYRRILHAAVAQSGLTVSPISFTSLLPYEDFKLIYNEVISTLENRSNLDNFNQVNAFQRINFRNSKIVPQVKAFTKLVDNYQNFVKTGKKILNIDRQFLNPVLKVAITKGTIPMLIERSTQTQYGDSDIILYSYQSDISSKDLAKARKNDDYSYSHKVLMKKVYNEDGTPYISTTISKGVTYNKYLYKAINAWGDGIYANESYDKLIPEDEDSTIGRPSVLDNGIDKVQKKDVNSNMVTAEVEDKTILDILKGAEEKKDIMGNKQYSKLTPEEMNYLLSLDKSSPEGFPETKRPNEKCGG